MKTSFFLGILLSGLATIIGVISTAIPYWLYVSGPGEKIYTGLWEMCVDYHSTTSCLKFDIKNIEDWSRAVQALVVIGVILFGLGCIMVMCYARTESQPKLLTFGSLGIFAGAVAFIIGVSIYGAKAKEYGLPGSVFSAGFYLGILAAVLGFLACVALFSPKRAEGYSPV